MSHWGILLKYYSSDTECAMQVGRPNIYFLLIFRCLETWSRTLYFTDSINLLIHVRSLPTAISTIRHVILPLTKITDTVESEIVRMQLLSKNLSQNTDLSIRGRFIFFWLWTLCSLQFLCWFQLIWCQTMPFLRRKLNISSITGLLNLNTYSWEKQKLFKTRKER